MIDSYSRRSVLQGVSLLGGAMTTGCISVDPNVRERYLGFYRITHLNQSDGGQTVQIIPQASLVGDDEWAQLHNVTIIGYDASGATVCRHDLGDVTQSGELSPIDLHCSERPQTIRYEAEESACGEDTELDYAEYVGRRDGSHTWAFRDPNCENR